MAKNKSDIEELDELNRHLIKIAKSTSCEVSESIAIFNGSVKYLAVKNKIEPEGNEGDGWSKFRQGSGGRGKSSDDTQQKKTSRTNSTAARNSSPYSTAASIASLSQENDSRRHDDSSNGVDLVQSPRPASGSFPLPSGGVHFGSTGNQGT